MTKIECETLGCKYNVKGICNREVLKIEDTPYYAICVSVCEGEMDNEKH